MALDPEFHEAEERDVEEALALAAEAFSDFRELSPSDRGHLLREIGQRILGLGDELLSRCHRETGLPLARLEAERTRTVNQLGMFADLIEEGSWVDARIDVALPDRTPVPRPDLRRMLIPLGPVVVFGSSNFPLAFSVAGGDTASALAAGCPVVVKANRAHPGTSEMVASAVRAAVDSCGMPPGVFSMLHGRGTTVGLALVLHPNTQAVGFTGSRAAGRALFDAAASRANPIPVFAEMASLNPVFLLPGALRHRRAEIAEGLLKSFTLGVGQYCTKPGLVFAVAGPELEAFSDVLSKLVTAAAPATMLHADISSSYRHGVESAASGGALLLARSATPPDPSKTEGEPVVMRTDAESFLKHPELAEEVFGPFTILVAARSLDELAEVAATIDGQLTATIHATESDLREATRLARLLELKAGRLIYNGFPTGVEVSPAMNHGGPYPATTDARFTSVGTAAVLRFVRPICYQGFPQALLPPELKSKNERRIWRLVNGRVADGHVPDRAVTDRGVDR